MTKADGQEAPGQETPRKANRKARLADELRANLARRKAQARSRRDGAADESPEGLGASGEGAGLGQSSKHDAGR